MRRYYTIRVLLDSGLWMSVEDIESDKPQRAIAKFKRFQPTYAKCARIVAYPANGKMPVALHNKQEESTH